MNVPGYGGGGRYAGAFGGTQALLSLLTRRVAAVLVRYVGGWMMLGSTVGGGSMLSFAGRRRKYTTAAIAKTKNTAKRMMTTHVRLKAASTSAGATAVAFVELVSLVVVDVVTVVVDVVTVVVDVLVKVVVVSVFVVVVVVNDVVVVVDGMQVPQSIGQRSEIDWLKTASLHISAPNVSQLSGSSNPLQSRMQLLQSARQSSLMRNPEVSDSSSQWLVSNKLQSEGSGVP